MKILDLAKRLIRLAGLRVRSAESPSGDIEILYTGLRPGEKLYEELLIGENPEPTSHPRIIRAQEADLEWDELLQLLDAIDTACRAYDGAGVENLLKRAVAGYEPRNNLANQPNSISSTETESRLSRAHMVSRQRFS